MDKVLKKNGHPKTLGAVFDLSLRGILLSNNLLCVKLRGSVMRRREAVRLFREICECIPEAPISSALLMPERSSKEKFELRINVALDGKSLQNVKSLVEKHRMNLEENNGSLLIYAAEPKQIGIAVSR
jgi:hypothetical protein